MFTLSDAIRFSPIVDMNCPDRQPGIYKTPYRGWVWLATFVAGIGFWVSVGYAIWTLIAG